LQGILPGLTRVDIGKEIPVPCCNSAPLNERAQTLDYK
jgi:hypothetical protein